MVPLPTMSMEHQCQYQHQYQYQYQYQHHSNVNITLPLPRTITVARKRGLRWHAWSIPAWAACAFEQIRYPNKNKANDEIRWKYSRNWSIWKIASAIVLLNCMACELTWPKPVRHRTIPMLKLPNSNTCYNASATSVCPFLQCPNHTPSRSCGYSWLCPYRWCHLRTTAVFSSIMCRLEPDC